MPRNYKSTLDAKTLDTSMNTSVLTMRLNNITGIPTYPFTMVIDPDSANEEIVTVTSLSSGTTVNVSRAQDGTSAVAHDAGVTVRHMITARDLQEPQDHIGASTNVHGLSGGADVVGTSSVQTLTNKVLTAPTITGGTLTSSTLTTPTIASFANATHTHLDATGGGVIYYSLNAQTANYTLVLTDAGKVIPVNSASANTVTIPLNSNVAFPIGTVITLVQTGAGQTTVSPDTGVTLQGEGAKYKLKAQYAAGSILKTAINTWVIFGNLAV